jgi:hypothetical protein
MLSLFVIILAILTLVSGGNSVSIDIGGETLAENILGAFTIIIMVLDIVIISFFVSRFFK